MSGTMNRAGGASTMRHVAAGMLLLAACQPRPNEAAASAGASGTPVAQAVSLACDSTVGLLAAGASAAALRGHYELVLRAATGARAGAATSGRLWLEPSARSASGAVRYPLVGRSDLRADAVGGSVPGSAASSDPRRPGVLVLDYPRGADPAGPRDITLRLGDEANAASLAGDRFDGAYMALHVRRIGGSGFAGRWDSAQDGARAGGYFCARPAVDR